jgi:cell division protein FtsQ
MALTEPIRAQTVQLRVLSADRIEIRLLSGATVMWGSAEQSDLKGEVLTGLLARSASHYDVSSPSHPATR